MFQKVSKDGKLPLGNSQNRISADTSIEGDLISSGGFRIDGKILGTLKTPEKIVIGKEGAVTGKIECGNADIEGSFSGILIVKGILSLKSTAIIDGAVTTSKLSVEPGAVFNATCEMTNTIKTSPITTARTT